MPNKTHMQEATRMLQELLNNECWEEARTLILGWLEEDPEDHWLLAELSNTYYEEHNYEKALHYVEQALRFAPKCPLVLWHYAGALDMLERDEEAINVWKKIVKRGVNSIAYGECGEGIRRARSFVNDSRYRIGLAYADLGKPHLAKKYIREHINNRGRNTPSSYNLRNVRKKLAMVEAGKNPRQNI